MFVTQLWTVGQVARVPLWSESRKTILYSSLEIAEMLTMSPETIKRRIATAKARGTLYREQGPPAGGMGRPVQYMDVLSLGLSLPPTANDQKVLPLKSDPKVPTLGSDFRVTSGLLGHAPSESSQTEEAAISRLNDITTLVSQDLTQKSRLLGHTELSQIVRTDPSILLEQARGATYQDTDPAAARELHAAILPVLITRSGSRERGEQVNAVAAARGVDVATVRGWVRRFEAEGLSGLQPQQRRDRGAFRLSQETLQLICAAIVTNPITTSSRKLHDTLLLAVPDAMMVRRGGRDHLVSYKTVDRIRDSLLAHPQLRLMLINADDRKEFLRTYMGRVIASHANSMWQLDMTRCDVLVYDEEADTIYRPRVQAIIDVFSGCIPGLSFSPDETQVQADLALFRALLPKNGPLASRYPIYGKPEKIYIDNGKTYSSEHFERVARELGIEMIHSRPYVSHTRGKIERFFGTLHTFERTLPGYVGYDAADRHTEELERLTVATRRWQDTGRDPGEGRRLMTLREYQNAVLHWLIVDYHQHMEHGQTRLEWFTSSAPAHTLIEFDLAELLIHFAHRTERVVRPDCTVQVDNVLWACEGGELGSYAGSRVLVLRDEMALGPDLRMIAIRERAGHLRILGHATRAPDNALSIEAGDLRRANKLAKREALGLADEARASIADPALLVRRQHERQLPVVAVAPLEPSARGRLSSVTPTPVEKPDLGDFGKSFLKTPEPVDMATFMASLLEDE